MYRERIDRLKRILEGQNLDVILLFNPANLFYYFGYYDIKGRSIGIIFKNDYKSVLISSAFAEKEVREGSFTENLKFYSPSTVDKYQLLSNTLHDYLLHNNIRVGVEEQHISMADYKCLKGVLEGCSLKPAASLPAKVRAIKDQEEITMMQLAYEAAEMGGSATSNAIREGITELQLDRAGNVVFSELIEDQSFTDQFQEITSTVAGIHRTTPPFNLSSKNKVRSGDPVMHVRAVIYNRYWSEYERTFYCGKVSSELKKIDCIVFEAQKSAISSIRPGVTASSIDDAARRVIIDAGYGDYIYHFSGHAMGIERQEKPFLDQGDETIIQAGMVLSVEPGIYVPEVGGVRHSSMVVVTEEGTTVF